MYCTCLDIWLIFDCSRRLNLDFFPELPGLDVGDQVTIKLREAGYQVFACPNTIWQPDLASRIPLSSPFRELHVDRAFDDEGNLIFLAPWSWSQEIVGSAQQGNKLRKSGLCCTKRIGSGMWMALYPERSAVARIEPSELTIKSCCKTWGRLFGVT